MKFSEIIGQSPIKNYLIQTVRNSRVSHAQLFVGPPGNGKLALAIAYAQFISCTDKQYFPEGSDLAADSCGVCPSCIKFSKLIHPDLHFIYPIITTKDIKKPKSTDFVKQFRELMLSKDCFINLNQWYETIGVENKQGIINADDCDEIIRKVGMKAYEADYKVVIIWMVEKLYHAAAPKLLKVLEEPPDKTLFILISENKDQILNTILSRTQLVKVPRLANKEINSILIEKHELSEIRARKITNLANGDYNLALDLINEEDDEDNYLETLRQWFRHCYLLKASDRVDLVSFVEELAKLGREKQKAFLQYGLKILRNALINNEGDDKNLKMEDAEAEFVTNFAKTQNPERIEKISDLLNQAVYHVERNANPKILFMDLSLTLHSLMRS